MAAEDALLGHELELVRESAKRCCERGDVVQGRRMSYDELLHVSAEGGDCASHERDLIRPSDVHVERVRGRGERAAPMPRRRPDRERELGAAHLVDRSQIRAGLLDLHRRADRDSPCALRARQHRAERRHVEDRMLARGHDRERVPLARDLRVARRGRGGVLGGRGAAEREQVRIDARLGGAVDDDLVDERARGLGELTVELFEHARVGDSDGQLHAAVAAREDEVRPEAHD